MPNSIASVSKQTEAHLTSVQATKIIDPPTSRFRYTPIRYPIFCGFHRAACAYKCLHLFFCFYLFLGVYDSHFLFFLFFFIPSSSSRQTKLKCAFRQEYLQHIQSNLGLIRGDHMTSIKYLKEGQSLGGTCQSLTLPIMFLGGTKVLPTIP